MATAAKADAEMRRMETSHEGTVSGGAALHAVCFIISFGITLFFFLLGNVLSFCCRYGFLVKFIAN